MKTNKILLIIIFILIVLSCASPKPEEDKVYYPTSAVGELLTLEWSDEFDGRYLDTTKWEAPNGMPRQGASHWMRDQVSVSDGVLRLGITKTSGAPNVSYDCGAVRTKRAYSEDLFTQTYGYFEARCKLPNNISADYWAAFWMMTGEVADGQPDTREGHEIDIMESFTISNGGNHKLTMHWNGYDDNHNLWSGDMGTHPQLLDGEYHVYGLYWDEEKFISYIDGIEVGRTNFKDKGEKSGMVPSNGPSRKPGYIKLSCEAADWPGGEGWEDPLPETDEFLVDYVRVYSGYLP